MTQLRPILSICIPTYNRCDILKDVLEQYVNNPEFDNDVELVISDNSSTDDTEIICRDISEKYHNIIYHRNEENIRDANFPKVLSLANGEYLKLYNDCVYCNEESLKYIKDVAKNHVNDRTPLFFTSNYVYTRYKAEVVRGEGLDDYVKIVSTFVTYNNLFGVWREQWEQVKDKKKYSSLQLQQVDWTYQIVSNHQGCIIYDKPTFQGSEVPLGVRRGYNWFQVHLDNYYKIMQPYVERGEISPTTLKEDKHNLLEHFKREFCLTLFYNFDHNWKYDTKGTVPLIIKYYGRDSYLAFYLLKLPFYYIYYIIRMYGGRLFRALKKKISA